MNGTKFRPAISAVLLLIPMFVSHGDPLRASSPGESSKTLSNGQKLTESSLRRVAARGINDELQEIVEKKTGDLSEGDRGERFRKNRESFRREVVNRTGTPAFFSRGQFLERIVRESGGPGIPSTNFSRRTLGPSELINTTRRFIRATNQFLEALGERNASR
jgi:hypothetical protein